MKLPKMDQTNSGASCVFLLGFRLYLYSKFNSNETHLIYNISYNIITSLVYIHKIIFLFFL